MMGAEGVQAVLVVKMAVRVAKGAEAVLMVAVAVRVATEVAVASAD